jgi:hypothetical protein
VYFNPMESQALHSGSCVSFLQSRGSPDASPLMTEYMGAIGAPFHLGKQSDAAIRAIFLMAGFTKVVLWRVACVSDVWSADKSVANYRGFSSVERDEAFWTELSEKYQRVIDTGVPVALEAVIVLCKK